MSTLPKTSKYAVTSRFLGFSLNYQRLVFPTVSPILSMSVPISTALGSSTGVSSERSDVLFGCEKHLLAHDN